MMKRCVLVLLICGMGVVLTACEEPVDEPNAAAELVTAEGDEQLRSPNDPHVPTGLGAWFEGWYTRVSDLDGNRSIAIIAASHKPNGVAYEPGLIMPGYIGILISDGNGSETKSFEYFPEQSYILKDGEPVSENPDFWSPADFEWIAPGFGSVTENSVDIEVPGVVSVHVQTGDPLPWNDCFSEAGPEGILSFLPLPLHWHVSSLGSLSTYEYTIYDDAGDIHIASEGYAHLEKNWGAGFPLAWSWGQGIADDNNAQFVYGGGRVELIPGLVIKPWIMGYRSDRLSWDFNFANLGTKFTTEVSSCDGDFFMRVKDPTRTLELHAVAPLESFGDVSIPTADGWVPGTGGESFSATVTVRAYWHTPWGGLFGIEHFIEETTFHNAALEFGADWVCDE